MSSPTMLDVYCHKKATRYCEKVVLRIRNVWLVKRFDEKNASKDHIVTHGVPANQMMICGEKEQQR